MPAPRLLIGLGVLVVAVVLFLVLRPGGDDEPVRDVGAPAETAQAELDGAPDEQDAEEPADEPASVPTTQQDPLPGEDEPDAEPDPAPAPEGATLAIVVRGGVPEGGIQRLTVRQGEEVRIVVRSDTADEIHLHGYELVRSVGPGAPAQLRFRATVPGRFEIETHERQVLVGELEVRP